MKTIVGCGVLGKSSAECASLGYACQLSFTSQEAKTLTFHSTHVPRPFDTGNLETKTDTQEGHLFLPCPFDGGDHAFCATKTETARYDDTPEDEKKPSAKECYPRE